MRGKSKEEQRTSLHLRQMSWFKLEEDGVTDDKILEMEIEGVKVHFKISRIKMMSLNDFPWVFEVEHVQMVDANFEDEESNWTKVKMDDIASKILSNEYKVKNGWGSSRVSPLIS